jgi:uncharacterized protein (DUF4415 family)
MKSSTRSGDKYTDAPGDVAEEIRGAIQIPDDMPGPSELRREIKKSVTLRLDPDVYEWFQDPGPGYQTRINAVLRAYMNSQQAPTRAHSKKVHRPKGKPAHR